MEHGTDDPVDARRRRSVGGVALLAAGATLIGAVLVVMATLRIVMLLTKQRRMRSFSQHRGISGGSGGGRQMMQRLARNELDVAATAIGIRPGELRRAVEDGRSISAVAADAGGSLQRVVHAVVRDASAKVDRAVADGNVARNRTRIVPNRLPGLGGALVLRTPAMLAGAGASHD